MGDARNSTGKLGRGRGGCWGEGVHFGWRVQARIKVVNRLMHAPAGKLFAGLRHAGDFEWCGFNGVGIGM